MTAEKRTQTNVDRQATVDDVRRTLGDVDDTVLVEILSNRPTLRDLSEAALWVRGNSDLETREHSELSAVAAAIAEILVREEEEEQFAERD
jgi:hypothetical protein